MSYPEPVPISFPNLENFPPGSRMDFFGLNHDTGEFEKVGEGLVSSDGQTIDSIGGVVHANSWHGVVPQPPMSEPGSDSSNSSSGSGCGSGGGGPGAGSGDSGSSGEFGACVIGYQYDALDRLIDDRIKGGTSDSYGYDLNGNRTSRVRNALEMTRYDYSPDSNRLNLVEKRFRGNNAVVPVQPSQTRTYNDANRWDQLFIEGALKATYIHNAMGQRTRKVVVNADNTISTTVYHYDFQGMLISETNERGEPIKDYIWLDYAPIAQIEYDAIADSDTIYYLHTDHLMTPRFATDSGGNIVWRWEGEAFGDTLSKSDPDGNGKDVVVNLRFAGQYYDSESQLYYNYFRYYDPTAGRYITSDPIGLDGGLNTYAYVDGNPLYWTDYYGLRGARRGGNPYRDHIPVLRPDPIPHHPPNNNSQPTPNSPMPP